VVEDLMRAVAHYRDVLGFDVAFVYGEPPYYAGLCRGHVTIHLHAAGEASRPPGTSALCVFVDDADRIHEELRGRGARIEVEIADRPYGMRDFNVRDPDGNELVFGSALGEAAGGPAIVLVDHGSREADANALLEGVAERLRACLPGRRVEVAHMELAAPGLAEAIGACAAAGAREIVVVPWFLSRGRHVTQDVPRLAAEAAARHPGVAVRVAEPVGLHPAMLEILVARVSEE
jgi:catechol 2,3-dioxygenase-like lactoylglutathione lyase family enzyme